jgi:hypothetical protein
MAKRKRPKGSTVIYKTLHIELKIESHEPHKKGVNSDAPGGWAGSCSSSAYFDSIIGNIVTYM